MGEVKTYRSQYQGSKHSGLLHRETLQVLFAPTLITHTQGLTNEPHLDLLDIVRIAKNTFQFGVLRPEHEKKADARDDNEHADKNVPPLEEEQSLDVAPSLGFGACVSLLIRADGRSTLFAA